MKPHFARHLKSILARFLRFPAAAQHVPHDAPGEEFGDALASLLIIGMDGAGAQ
jgi:hypothetical protein